MTSTYFRTLKIFQRMDIMKEIRPIMIPVLIRRDVERVKEQAAVVLEIRGDEVIKKVNPKPVLNVIAIVGSGEAFGRHFDEALLCEVGISRTRPYSQPHGIKKQKNSYARRRKWFFMTDEQYRSVAPELFRSIQELVDTRISGWKNGVDNPYFVKTTKHYFTIRGKKIQKNERKLTKQCSARFSVDLRDEVIIKDIYNQEINSKENIGKLKSFARYIDKSLSKYRLEGYSRKFNKLKRVEELMPQLGNKKPYLLFEMIKYIPKGRSNPLWEELYNLISEVTGINDISKERKLADSALSGVSERLGEISLDVVRESPRGYIVIDVLTSIQTKGTYVQSA